MKNVLFLAPTEGNGGIVSWAKNYLTNYDNKEFRLINVGVSKRRAKIKEPSFFRRILDGLDQSDDLVSSSLIGIVGGQLRLALINYQELI